MFHAKAVCIVNGRLESEYLPINFNNDLYLRGKSREDVYFLADLMLIPLFLE